ncbi:unnamed protein product [Chrysoparadoxa australica]
MVCPSNRLPSGSHMNAAALGAGHMSWSTVKKDSMHATSLLLAPGVAAAAAGVREALGVEPEGRIVLAPLWMQGVGSMGMLALFLRGSMPHEHLLPQFVSHCACHLAAAAKRLMRKASLLAITAVAVEGRVARTAGTMYRGQVTSVADIGPGGIIAQHLTYILAQGVELGVVCELYWAIIRAIEICLPWIGGIDIVYLSSLPAEEEIFLEHSPNPSEPTLFNKNMVVTDHFQESIVATSTSGITMRSFWRTGQRGWMDACHRWGGGARPLDLDVLAAEWEVCTAEGPMPFRAHTGHIVLPLCHRRVETDERVMGHGILLYPGQDWSLEKHFMFFRELAATASKRFSLLEAQQQAWPAV